MTRWTWKTQRRWAVEGLAYLTFDAGVKEVCGGCSCSESSVPAQQGSPGFLQWSRDAD